MRRVSVPAAFDMDDETFKKHANKRHVGIDFLGPFTQHDTAEAVLKPSRRAHDYWHSVQPELYDHDHLEET